MSVPRIRQVCRPLRGVSSSSGDGGGDGSGGGGREETERAGAVWIENNRLFEGVKKRAAKELSSFSYIH